MGAAPGVLASYEDSVRTICFVQDDMFLGSALWARMSAMLVRGTLHEDQLVRLERTDRPQLIWRDIDRDIELSTYSPTAAGNLLAQAAGNQNATSAILSLRYGTKRVIFTADSDVSQWRSIRALVKHPMSCSVASVPHHAGRSFANAVDLNWMFNEGVRADVAVISAGTNNRHGHPRKDVIDELKGSGASIICTQITGQCCNNLETIRPGVLPILPSIPSRSRSTSDITTSGNSRNVACGGTVVLRTDGSSLSIDRIADHQAAIDALAASTMAVPMCR